MMISVNVSNQDQPVPVLSRARKDSAMTIITSTAGAYGYGAYAHTCYRPTWCALAGGIGNACHGSHTFNGEEIWP